jgi:hypothetical protein
MRVRETETLLRQRTAGARMPDTPNPRAQHDSGQNGTLEQARA